MAVKQKPWCMSRFMGLLSMKVCVCVGGMGGHVIWSPILLKPLLFCLLFGLLEALKEKHRKMERNIQRTSDRELHLRLCQANGL